MPLPLGHMAIGFTAYDLYSRDNSALSSLRIAALVAILANLPDIDVVIGLLVNGNGNALHRGPTHSLLFVLFMGYIASNVWRIGSGIPRIGFKPCFLVIISHVLVDFFLTKVPVSLFWPLEVNYTSGYSGLREAESIACKIVSNNKS